MTKVQNPIFSFLIPTRGRPKSLLRLLDSFKEKTDNLQSMEIILVIDEDDHEMTDFIFNDIPLKRVMVKSGMNMGALNMAGYNASSGKYIMLLNDDVVVQTDRWDKKILYCFNSFSDGVVLIHVNDLIFKEKLCTFPFVSRVFCDIVGGICPTEYRRHRIDDHIYNIFNLLGVLGEKRIVYLPDVIFEHYHYVINKKGKREYKHNDAIEENDIHLFNSLFMQRKQIALKIMEHIDQFAQREKFKNRIRHLEKVTDPFSIRTSAYIHTRPDGFIHTSSNTRVTIGVVSANCQSSVARKCIDNIKRFTNNYDLILLDNNFGPEFSHPREMNKIMDITRTDYLVLMDDDVFVEPNWLDGLLKHIRSNIGVVTPLHKDRNGVLSYAGIIFNPDDSGNHGHIISHIDKPTPTMTLCSALLLIDMKKCEDIRFSESYDKYFLDIDYGLRIWESGFQVICSPDTVITHLGGGTIIHGSRLANKIFKKQMQIFEQEWCKSKRLSRLKNNIFQKIPELQAQLDLSSQVYNLLTHDPSESMKDYQARAEQLFNKIEPYPTLKQFILDHICKNISGQFPCVDDKEKGYLAFLVGLCGHPVMIEQNYKGFNIFLCYQTYYAIPKSEKIFNLNLIKQNNYSLSYTATNLETIKREIDYDALKNIIPKKPGIHEKVSAFIQLQYTRSQVVLHAIVWIVKKSFLMFYNEIKMPGFFLRVTGLFRLWGKRYKKAIETPDVVVKETKKRIVQEFPKTSLRERIRTFFWFRYNHFRLIFHAQTQKWIIQKKNAIPDESLPEDQHRSKADRIEDYDADTVLIDPNYKGCIIVQDIKGFHAYPVDEWISHSMALMPRFSARSNGGIRRLIHEGVPRLIEKNYKGFSIYSFEHFFFAIDALKETFSLEYLRKDKYDSFTIAYSIPETKNAIDQIMTKQTSAPKCNSLFFSNLPKEDSNALLKHYEDQHITFLVKKTESWFWPDDKILLLEGNPLTNKSDFRLDSTSSEFLSHLRSANFSRVIIPSDLCKIIHDNSIVHLASEISDNVEIVYPQGITRCYRGENLKRFLYNTAYISSMLEVVPDLTGKKVLEIGCSDGLVCDIMSQLGADRVVGIDLLRSVGCGYRDEKIEYHIMNCANMDFPDKSFDVVFSIATLEHVADPYIVFNELKRVTKVGGYCYIQAGPLYHSPYGHHMFGYFNDYPWIHLRLSTDEIIKYTKRNCIDAKIQSDFGITCDDYIRGMLNQDHLNGLFLQEYRLNAFMAYNDIKVEMFNIHYEGREYLTPEILMEVSQFEPNNLIENGFELIFRRLQ